MFLQDLGNRSDRDRPRRKVEFKTAIVDLEGRVLMSGTQVHLPRVHTAHLVFLSP